MRLSELIAHLSSERVAELARTVVPGASDINPSLLPHRLELVLGQTGYVEQVVLGHRPPVASLLLRLLESAGNVIETGDGKIEVGKETSLWCNRVTAGDLANRTPERTLLYRRMLEAAWGNDLSLDPSEIRMLRLLREQLGLFRIEHFLLAYHATIQPHWRAEDEFERVVKDLLDAGVIFEVEARKLALPVELVPHVRKALGVELSREAARRLLARLDSGSHLKAALGDHDLATSGSKQDRIERIVDQFVPMHRVVDTMHIAEARDLLRSLELPVTGSKEDLVHRIVEHFAAERDIEEREDEHERGDAAPEPRLLQREAFSSLFAGLTGHQLHTLLLAFDLRTSGTKDVRISTLWDSPLSEETLLSKLKGPELEDLLARNDLAPRGSKAEKIARLIAAFRGTEPEPKGTVAREVEAPPWQAPAPSGDRTMLSEGITRALRGVELSSKSPTRFHPVREYLSTQLGLSVDDIGVKYLGDSRNHRNRIGEALRGHPGLLVLLASEDEASAVLDAARSRVALSSETCCALYCPTGGDAEWVGHALLSVADSPIARHVAELEPGMEVEFVEPNSLVDETQTAELLRRAQDELAREWELTDAPIETRVRRALSLALERSNPVIRTKHISEARNVGNRISEAVGAGCAAVVLIVPSELAEAAKAEASRQMVGLSEPALALIISEADDGGYSHPLLVSRDNEALKRRG